jgi:hypothetical protein
MPESNIWKFDDRILLPGIHNSWLPFRDDKLHLLDQSLSPSQAAITPNEAKAYFLAETSLCRMIRRCTTSVTISHDKEVYAPIIAVELAHQVESWYDHLPPSLRFNRDVSVSGPPCANDYTSPFSLSTLAAVTNYLQMQYHLILAGIYWPAVYSATYTDTLPPQTLTGCALFFDAYSSYIRSAARAVRDCPQAPWSILARFVCTNTLFEMLYPVLTSFAVFSLQLWQHSKARMCPVSVLFCYQISCTVSPWQQKYSKLRKW